MKTTLPKNPGVDRGWSIVDVNDIPLGRAAVVIANLLRGKNRVDFSPQVDIGDFVVVLNAAKVKLTGKKEEQKIYQDFSGYRGGLKETKASIVRQKHPDRLIRDAVKGMLPKNRLGRTYYKRLKVYEGEEHPHVMHSPSIVEVK
jgi:large subunit ribosomal protein L13